MSMCFFRQQERKAIGMYYTLCSDVYLVKGKKRSCIYDFGNEKLYSINDLLSNKIEQINRGELKEGDANPELVAPINFFLQAGVVRLAEKPQMHSIEEIRRKEEHTGLKFAWIEITDKCNLRCRHCYNESGIQCKKVMPLEAFEEVVDALVGLNVSKIQIIGGEPFFEKPLLREMLDYAISKFEFIEVFTNGTLLDYTWYDYLAKNNIHMALSVYSYDQCEHDKVTGISGSWARTNETIRLLKEHRIPYRICNVLMKDIGLGRKENSLYTLSEKGDIVRLSGRSNLSLLSRELLKKKLITKETFQKPIKKEFCRRLLMGHNCFRDKIYISASLDIFPCVMERRIKHGTIRNGKINLDEKIRSLTKEKIEGCAQCEYRYACFDCRPDSIDSNIYAKPWYCTYNPDTGEWINEDIFINKLERKYNCTLE